MTKAFQIFAAILALLGTVLVQKNYPLSGFVFYALAIASYLTSLVIHRKEDRSKQDAENSKIHIEQTKQQIDLLKLATDAYGGKQRLINNLIATLNSLDIPESEKHELYEKVIPKLNPRLRRGELQKLCCSI